MIKLDGQSITTKVTYMINKSLVIMVVALIAFMFGEQIAIRNIERDCIYLEKFRHDIKVYSCKKTH